MASGFAAEPFESPDEEGHQDGTFSEELDALAHRRHIDDRFDGWNIGTTGGECQQAEQDHRHVEE